MSEEAIGWTIGISAIVLGIAVMCGGLWLDSLECEAKANAMNVSRSWGAIQGCMITVRGKTVPLKSYRAVN